LKNFPIHFWKVVGGLGLWGGLERGLGNQERFRKKAQFGNLGGLTGVG